MSSGGGGAWFDNGQGGSSTGANEAAGGYNADYDMPSQVTVNNGLTLTAIQKTTQSGYPETSGVVSTNGKMEFDGGYLQISMKAPAGDGSWPALWLLPGSGAGSAANDATEIDLEEGGFLWGNANPNDVMSSTVHNPDGSQSGTSVNTGVDLTAGYNTYGMDWVPGKSITFYLNGKVTSTVTSAQATIPNMPMELIMVEAVGDASSSSWRTGYDSSTPQSMAMQIQDVQLYQASGLGETIMGGSINNGGVATGSGGTTGGSTSGTGGGTTSTPPAAPVITKGVANANETVTLTGTATAGSTVLLSDGVALGSTTASGTGGWSFTTGQLAPGGYAFQATDTTSSGTSAASNAVNVTVSAPTSSIVVVPVISKGWANANHSVTLVGAATAGSTVTLYSNSGTRIGSARVGVASGTWAFTTGVLQPGGHGFRATDTTSAGTSAKSASLGVWVPSSTTSLDLKHAMALGSVLSSLDSHLGSALTASGASHAAASVTPLLAAGPTTHVALH